MSPVPAEPVPIWVGGLSEPALRRAARRGDGWISDLHTTGGAARDRRAKLARGRAPTRSAPAGPFAVRGGGEGRLHLDGYRRAADAGVTHLQTMPWIFYAGGGDSLEAKCDGIRRFGEEIVAKLAGAP